jgi:hypothetical protein
VEIKFLPLVVHPPLYKKRAYPELSLTVIEARERGGGKKEERVVWKLLTNLPVRSLSAAIEKLRWYALRWKIEVCQSQPVKMAWRPLKVLITTIHLRG